MDDGKAILTIYTDKYDSKEENIANGGMSGKVFLDNLPDGAGADFNDIDMAFQYAKDNGIEIGRIDFHYLDSDDFQSFWKFNVEQW